MKVSDVLLAIFAIMLAGNVANVWYLSIGILMIPLGIWLFLAVLKLALILYLIWEFGNND